MSECGEVEVSYTKSGIPKYAVRIWHEELNKFKVVKADTKDDLVAKAATQMKAWDEQWNRQVEREEEARRKEDERNARLAEAERRTTEAQTLLERVQNTLAHTLDVDDRIDWESLKVLGDYPAPKPAKPTPPPVPRALTVPREPQSSDVQYQPVKEMLDTLLPSRRQRKLDLAAAQFKADHEEWSRKRATELERVKRETVVYRRTVAEQQQQYRVAVARWNRGRETFLKQREERNRKVDIIKERYLGGHLNIVPSYCDLVLKRSQYPEFFPKTFELDYNPETRMLVVDYELPAPGGMPTLTEVRYVASRDEFNEKHLSDSQLKRLYDDVLYQIALRTIHELFESDVIEALSAVVFNGYVRAVDPATGNETFGCIFSVQAGREEFLAINLAGVDAKACFRKLRGVGSSQLHSLTPVAPLVQISKEDKRFISSYDVAEKLQEGHNLAAMDWGDFEHLIRELFEKEFAAGGGEVKVTQASRDGGIDAVVFDPDPIRGGKIVIQAKRYTNVVGVSAVRDLYGTVMNEGANKGILVATSSYGPDAYEFARGKPLTLLDGGNLLHLLERHGHKFRIDLKEAKRMLAERDAS